MTAPGDGNDELLVDVCGLHYDLDGWHAYLMGFARYAPGYLRKFAPRFCVIARADLGIYSTKLAESAAAAVDYLIECGGGFDESFDTYTSRMREEGLSHQILHGWGWPDRNERDVNLRVAENAARAPDLFSAWAHVPLRDPHRASTLLEAYVREHGMIGLSLVPFFDSLGASDQRCRPVFEKANELKIPVWLHAGQNFSNTISTDLSHVRHVDRIAAAFPDLTLLIGHAGWPWILDAIAICQRHDNVYLEFSSHRPSLMPSLGSGWEPLLLHGNAALRDRVMFGTSAWVSPKSVKELAAETKNLPLKPETIRRWIGANARYALGLDHLAIERRATPG